MEKIETSKHALKRAKERGIPEEWAGEVIRNPEGTSSVKFGRIASCKRFGDDYVVVIYEGIDRIVVVTTVKIDKERLERYGFSGV
ncbi:MAG: DUF4258 domain-containing protein [Euryarchaeota archaeon]|nr:DUF4258 domain-containing protein [Euryarchaeota archaeon]